MMNKLASFIQAFAYQVYLNTLIMGYCDEQGHQEDVSFFSRRHLRHTFTDAFRAARYSVHPDNDDCPF